MGDVNQVTKMTGYIRNKFSGVELVWQKLKLDNWISIHYIDSFIELKFFLH